MTSGASEMTSFLAVPTENNQSTDNSMSPQRSSSPGSAQIPIQDPFAVSNQVPAISPTKSLHLNQQQLIATQATSRATPRDASHDIAHVPALLTPVTARDQSRVGTALAPTSSTTTPTSSTTSTSLGSFRTRARAGTLPSRFQSSYTTSLSNPSSTVSSFDPTSTPLSGLESLTISPLDNTSLASSSSQSSRTRIRSGSLLGLSDSNSIWNNDNSIPNMSMNLGSQNSTSNNPNLASTTSTAGSNSSLPSFAGHHSSLSINNPSSLNPGNPANLNPANLNFGNLNSGGGLATHTPQSRVRSYTTNNALINDNPQSFYLQNIEESPNLFHPTTSHAISQSVSQAISNQASSTNNNGSANGPSSITPSSMASSNTLASGVHSLASSTEQQQQGLGRVTATFSDGNEVGSISSNLPPPSDQLNELINFGDMGNRPRAQTFQSGAQSSAQYIFNAVTQNFIGSTQQSGNPDLGNSNALNIDGSKDFAFDNRMIRKLPTELLLSSNNDRPLLVDNIDPNLLKWTSTFQDSTLGPLSLIHI